MMNQQTNVQVSEGSFPMGLVMIPAIIGTLVWVCVLMSRTAAF